MQAGKKLKEKYQSTQRLLPALRLVWQSSPRWTIARVVILDCSGYSASSCNLSGQTNYRYSRCQSHHCR